MAAVIITACDQLTFWMCSLSTQSFSSKLVHLAKSGISNMGLLEFVSYHTELCVYLLVFLTGIKLADQQETEL